MPNYRNAAAVYKKNSIETASPARLTLMLYDGAIRFANTALEGFDDNDYYKINTNIQRVEDIIVEFRETLDMKYPVAKDFDQVYDYIYRRLVEANMQKDKAILEEALGHIKTMRETWVKVMKANNVS
ncbi:MAG: flagellar export chaperone FliS [Lachnospiraceae bacterium]|jgi:flagellar protein FliS|nr:flagellar export chaperone FliS [Lachnospiraceae bacterium]MEE3460583.1 flagellar export chaperone FliS [Lachnospiraceae bacterium]